MAAFLSGYQALYRQALDRIEALEKERADLKNERDDTKRNLWIAQDDNDSLARTLHSIVQVRGEAPNEYLVYKRLPPGKHYNAVIAFLKGHPNVDDES